jgi:hypothetical protein
LLAGALRDAFEFQLDDETLACADAMPWSRSLAAYKAYTWCVSRRWLQ